MSFKGYNGILRKLGRNIVLPYKAIIHIMEKSVFGVNKDKEPIELCVDFGAGTLFWTSWLKNKAKSTYAVDVIYDEEEVVNSVICVNSIDKVNFDVKGEKLFWACDVFHHIDEDYINKRLLPKVMSTFDYICIKDIDCNQKFGNHMNRLHDRVINGEIIRDIDPNTLAVLFKENGYETECYKMRRLWYPHFLLIAKRK